MWIEGEELGLVTVRGERELLGRVLWESPGEEIPKSLELVQLWLYPGGVAGRGMETLTFVPICKWWICLPWRVVLSLHSPQNWA